MIFPQNLETKKNKKENKPQQQEKNEKLVSVIQFSNKMLD